MSIKEETKRASSETHLPENKQLNLVPERTIHDARLKIMIEFMSANLNQRISSGDIGREVRLSAAQVSRLFKKETGISPSEYLIRLRMERAAHLLSNSLLSVKEIMAVTGYGNRGHFLEHFKRYFGLAPSEYRKLVSRS